MIDTELRKTSKLLQELEQHKRRDMTMTEPTILGEGADLLSPTLIEEFARVAATNRVMVTLTVTPYYDEPQEDER